MEKMQQQGFSSLAEVSAELDRQDAVLGEMMKGFDENKSEKEFKKLMAECDAHIASMVGLHKLEATLKKQAK